MTKRTILQEADLIIDIAQNGEGLDAKVLREALDVDESQMSAPLDGPSFLLKLKEEGVL